MRHDPLQRMTIPGVLKLFEQQTAGKFPLSDFIPVPSCNSVTYAFIDGEQVTPLLRYSQSGSMPRRWVRIVSG